METKGLTCSIIFEAESANYGEGFGNITSLKKISRGDGNSYSYISRQALRYNIIEQLRWDNTPVSDADKVVQFAKDASIKEYPEIDFFGYMKTGKNSPNASANVRSATVRLSNAIALEPYNADLDFLTNMGMSKRKVGLENAIAQSEIHKSYYAYTITMDLDKIGLDEVLLTAKDKDAKKEKIEISNKEKADRVKNFLRVIKTLYRDIKGRRENLSPIFAIGGVYNIKNPFFENKLIVKKNNLSIELVQETMKLDKEVLENTLVAYVGSIFSNSDKIVSELQAKAIGDFFDILCKKVEEYYGE